MALKSSATHWEILNNHSQVNPQLLLKLLSGMVWQCLKWNKHLGMEIGANSYSFKLVLWQQNCNIWEHLWEQDNSSEEKCLEIQPLCSEETWMMSDLTCYKRKHFDPAADRRGSWRGKMWMTVLLSALFIVLGVFIFPAAGHTNESK